MRKIKYNIIYFNSDINILVKKIEDINKYKGVYGVPRGGLLLAMCISERCDIPLLDELPDTENSIFPVLVVDDIIDSGLTREKYSEYDFICLHSRIDYNSFCNMFPDNVMTKYVNILDRDAWVDYWWEKENDSITNIVTRLIEYIGDDPLREGLKETPERYNKAINHLFSGYNSHPKDIIKTFSAENYDEIILLKDIELYSMCEHHILPFYGKAHVAYIPDKKIIGISKLARLVDLYARRLQIQERIGEQVTSILMKYLEPKGAACIIEAEHLCMKMRGVEKQNSIMSTSSLKGIFLQKNTDGYAAREELLRLIKN